MRQTIRYNLTVEDLVAFNEFNLKKTSAPTKSPWIPVLLFVCVVVFSTTFALITLSVKWVSGPPFLMTLLLAFAVYLLFFRVRFPGLLRQRVRNIYGTSENKILLCEHILEVDDTGFTDKTAFSECRFAWGALERIERGKEHTYLYYGAVSAIIIPQQNIIEGDFSALLHAVQSYVNSGPQIAPH